jgi:hypothetical protein
MKIELNDPAMPKGTLFSVNALGTLENGKSVEFSDEEIAFFEQEQGRSIEEAFALNPNIKIAGKYVAKLADDETEKEVS